MNEGIGCITLLIIIGIFLAIGYTLDNISCHKVAKKLNYSCEYSIWTGCVLENNNNKKFLLEQLRQVNYNIVKEKN